MSNRPEKKRFIITHKDGTFTMTHPNGNETFNKDSRRLANVGFDMGADEVVHNYDLTILDRLINSK